MCAGLLMTLVALAQAPREGVIMLDGATSVKLAAFGRVTVEGTSEDGVLRYRWTGTPAALKTRNARGWCLVTVARSRTDPPPGELRVSLPAALARAVIGSDQGSISVKGIEGDVEVVTLAGNVSVTEVGGKLNVRTGGGVVQVGRVNGELKCLSGGGPIRVEEAWGAALLQTAGGDIVVRRSAGPLRASTAGNIEVQQADSTVYASTLGGLIEVRRAGGIVTVESAGGSILVGSAPGVRAESGGGPVKLKSISGPVHATTSSGSLVVGFAKEAKLASSYLSATSGDLTVFLPSNIAVTVRALNESAGWRGGITSEFPEFRVERRAYGSNAAAASGALNGGGAQLTLTVTSGSIHLRRAR